MMKPKRPHQAKQQNSTIDPDTYLKLSSVRILKVVEFFDGRPNPLSEQPSLSHKLSKQ